MSFTSRRLAAGVVAAAAALVIATPARATFPGGNGRIAYNFAPQNTNGNRRFYTIAPDGTGSAPLGVSGAQGRWSADGRTLVYTQDAEFGGVATYDTLTTSEHVLIRGNETNYTGDPSFAPWGEIAFTASRPGGGTGIDLMAGDGTDRRAFAIGGFKGSARLPTFSPDGHRIAFTGTPVGGGTPGVYVVGLDGGNLRRLADGSVQDWSPDGSTILFVRDTGSTGSLATVPAGGGATKSLMTDAFLGSYSPDGTELVLTRSRALAGGGTDDDLYITDLNGNPIRRLTSSDSNEFRGAWQPLAQSTGANPGVGAGGSNGSGAVGGGSTTITGSTGGTVGGGFVERDGRHGPSCSAFDGARITLHGPADGRWITVTIGGATEPEGGALTYTLAGVTQNERVLGPTPDARHGRGGNQVRLRDTRSRHGAGRVYRARFVVHDSIGRMCAGAVYVSVPRPPHQPAADSESQRYNSMIVYPRRHGVRGRRAHTRHG